MTGQPGILGGFQLSDPQRMAALAQGCDVAVTAGAGTGKTRTLVARYLVLLAGGLPLRRIIAMTFTRKAAREMRNRVRREIGMYLQRPDLSPTAAEMWAAYYNELDAARINTIHNICAEILRTHPAEAAVDPRFAILDETQSPLLVLEAAETTLAWAVEKEGMEPLFELLREGPLLGLISDLIIHRQTVEKIFTQIPANTIFDHWAARLAKHQERAVNELLTNQDFHLAQKVLVENQAVDNQDKAEIQRQLALQALDSRETDAFTDRLRNFALLDEINLMGGSQKNWAGGKDQLQEVKDALRTIRDCYQGQKILHQSLNDQDAAIARAMPAIHTIFDYACSIYWELKEAREGLDFDDLETLAIKLLEDRPDVQTYWQSQVSALLVDEFQDTNEQQRHFLRLLCPDPGKLFIVGDAKQSIYRFRGADVAVFAHEKENIAAQNGQLIDLDTSYRAHENLLKGMNRLLAPILGEDSPDRPLWVTPFAPLEPGTKIAANNLSAPFVECHLTLGPKPEAMPRAAEALAVRLFELHDNHHVDFGEMAVLCRASSAFQYYENAFDKAGIPYLTVAGKGFYDRPEIRDLLNALAAVADPNDDLALTGLLRSPACGLSDVTLYRLSQAREDGVSLWQSLQKINPIDNLDESMRLQAAINLISDLNRQAGRIPVADILKTFLDRTLYRAGLRQAGQIRPLRNVAKLLQDIQNSDLINIDAFLEYQDTLKDSGSREGEARSTSSGAVQIMTIHAAKGLEFPVVVLGDAGYDPRSRSSIAFDSQLGLLLPYKNENEERATSYSLGAAQRDKQDAAESDRLLYVALTRAEQMLLISGCSSPNRNGELSGKGWLGQLSEVIGMDNADLSTYDEQGAGSIKFNYALEDTAIQVTIYEPGYPALLNESLTHETEDFSFLSSEKDLKKPVFNTRSDESGEEEPQQRVWQVIPSVKSPRASERITGTLTHQALALWRFPGSGFDDWVRARAREYGITDEARLSNTQWEVQKMLNRLREHNLYRRIEAADRRWHELPFNCPTEGTGYIDILFQEGESWTVIEFKTDKVRNEAALQRLLHRKEYSQQLQRYRRAVKQLLEISPRLLLCFLNFDHEIRILTETDFVT